MLGSGLWRHGEERSGKIRCPGRISLEKLKGDDKGPRSQSGRWKESWHQTRNSEITVRTSPKRTGGSPCLHQALLSCETLCHRLLWQPKAHKVGKAAPADALSRPDTPTAATAHPPRCPAPPPAPYLPLSQAGCWGLPPLPQEQEYFGTWCTVSWPSLAWERGEGTRIPDRKAELSTRRHLLGCRQAVAPCFASHVPRSGSELLGRNPPLPTTAASSAQCLHPSPAFTSKN